MQSGNKYYNWVTPEIINAFQDRWKQGVEEHCNDNEEVGNEGETEEVEMGKDSDEGQTIIDDESNSDMRYQTEDQIQKFKFDFMGASAFVEQFQELDIKEKPQEKQGSIVISPGEGKIPTNILTTENWDLKTFPDLHIDGINGVDQKEE